MARVDGRGVAASFVGGAVGAPWTTFGVNIVGALLLGYFAILLQERLPLSNYRRPLLGTGLCGGMALGVLTGLTVGSTVSLLAGTAAVGSYTTFSTWMLETQRLSEERQHRVAVANLVISVVMGLSAAALGRLAGANL